MWQRNGSTQLGMWHIQACHGGVVLVVLAHRQIGHINSSIADSICAGDGSQDCLFMCQYERPTVEHETPRTCT